MEPELFFETYHGFPGDVWALALIVYGQIWRSVGGLGRDDEEKYPQCVMSAMQIFQNGGNKVQNNSGRIMQIRLVLSGKQSSGWLVGEALCDNKEMEWPEDLPEGGESLKSVVSKGLSASVPTASKFDRSMRYLQVTGNRCTAAEFLEQIPNEKEE